MESEKPAFTPGPWRAATILIGGKEPVDEAQVHAGRDTGTGPEVAICVWGKNASADARLIAASPDMFEALVAVRARFQHLRLGPDEADVLDRVATALSKALGKDAP